MPVWASAKNFWQILCNLQKLIDTIVNNAKCVTIEVITVEKTITLNLRVNPTVKQQAEDVLKQLGIPMETAIDMYLRQITMTGGIPFSLSLPKAPAALNADTMTDDQLLAALQVGIKEIQNGDTVDAASAFAQFREQHR